MSVPAEVDPRAFRQALGQFSTGVAIISAEGADGRPIGLTMSSFNSVSVDPPLILFSHRPQGVPAGDDRGQGLCGEYPGA